MSSKATKPIVLLLVFIGALFIFSIVTNKVNKDLTTAMEEASLPVMQFLYNDKELNELHGYVEEMDMLSMRDGLVPLEEDRALQLEIMTYGNKVDTLSYKIRSIDGTRLLVEENEAKIEVSQDKVECDISLPSIFEKNVEYNMEIILTMGEEKVYYYTRILQSADCYVEECLDFALTFHDYTFREDAADFIKNYMDPATGDATTLAYVDLTCTLKQITWAAFTGEKLTTPVASFKEINASYNVITLNYVMTNVNEETNEIEYYNVEEYYRLRQTPTRMYVLNFERTMEQIFRQENNFLLGDEAILLGIRDKEVEYKANESGDCIAFVQAGELWVFDRVNNTITQVFSFRSPEGIHPRENWDQHDIRIVKVDEAGSISFLTYGYMNRGEHEGKVGVGVYHYDGISHTIEEELFIPSNKSYEVLKAELGELMYVNEQKMLYITLNDDIYQVDMNSFTVSTLLASDTSDCYAVSPSGRYVAWVSPEMMNCSTSLVLEDLKTGMKYQISSGEGTYVKPIAFIGEDLIYGTAKTSDVYVDAMGQQQFFMYKIDIVNTSEDKQDVIKTYEPKDKYVGEITLEGGNIYVELLAKQKDHYAVTGTDIIMNRETVVTNGVSLIKSVTEIKQTQMAISMKEMKELKAVKFIRPKHLLLETERTLQLVQEPKNYYYVYVKGEVLLATQDVSDAIRLANKKYGVVVDSNLKYIFKRARNNSQSSLSNLAVSEADKNADVIAQCISIMLMYEDAGRNVSELLKKGQTAANVLQTALNDASVLELRGAAIDEVLYYIDQATPVFARTGVKDAVLLVGYNSSTIYYYDVVQGKVKTADYKEIEDMFLNGGKYFLAYVK